jgi:hypothetical protein
MLAGIKWKVQGKERRILDATIFACEFDLEVVKTDLDFFFGKLVATVLYHLVNCSPCAPETGGFSLAGLTLLLDAVFFARHFGGRCKE